MTNPRWRIQRLDVTVSTNDDVRRAAEGGEAEGLVVVAEKQSSGKGRLGRVWESPPGNLYCSVLLRPKNMPQDAGLYSFVAALAVHDVVAETLRKAPSSPPLVGGVRGEGVKLGKVERSQSSSPLPNPPHEGEGIKMITLKWPNDVLVNGKKISGILLEVASDALMLGMGLNISSFPSSTPYPATCLAAEGAEPDMNDLLNKLLEKLGSWCDLFQCEGFEPIRKAWLERAQHGPLTVRLPKEEIHGNYAGIDEKGRLRLQLEGGTEQVISTGDVFFPIKD